MKEGRGDPLCEIIVSTILCSPSRYDAFRIWHRCECSISGHPERHGSGKKKQHKHKFIGPDFPRTFLTLAPGCPGVKKFLPITGAAEKRTFRCGCPRFSARTFVQKVCVDFLAPNGHPVRRLLDHPEVDRSIATQMMADEFNFPWLEMQTDIPGPIRIIW